MINISTMTQTRYTYARGYCDEYAASAAMEDFYATGELGLESAAQIERYTTKGGKIRYSITIKGET